MILFFGQVEGLGGKAGRTREGEGGAQAEETRETKARVSARVPRPRVQQAARRGSGQGLRGRRAGCGVVDLRRAGRAAPKAQGGRTRAGFEEDGALVGFVLTHFHRLLVLSHSLKEIFAVHATFFKSFQHEMDDMVYLHESFSYNFMK